MKKLADRAYWVDELGEPQLVIDDNALRTWAEETRTTPANAQLFALQSRIIPLRYLKNFQALGFSEQIRICSSKVIVCGCGGLGGVLIDLLVRAGVGRLRVVDGDVFVPSNLNRQRLCDTEQISRPKAKVAEERVRAINPFVEIECYPERVDGGNVHELVRGMDLILDGLDNLDARFLLAGAARRLKIAFIHAAVAGWWGQISTFLPDSSFELERIYGDRRSRDPTENRLGVLGTTAAVVASLQAFEAIRLLSGRKPAYADRLLYFDGESGQMEILPL